MLALCQAQRGRDVSQKLATYFKPMSKRLQEQLHSVWELNQGLREKGRNAGKPRPQSSLG